MERFPLGTQTLYAELMELLLTYGTYRSIGHLQVLFFSAACSSYQCGITQLVMRPDILCIESLKQPGELSPLHLHNHIEEEKIQRVCKGYIFLPPFVQNFYLKILQKLFYLNLCILQGTFQSISINFIMIRNNYLPAIWVFHFYMTAFPMDLFEFHSV